MRLSALLDKAGYSADAPFEDVEISDIVTDSRRAGYNSMFVCLSGEKNDGHRHVTEALIGGAVCVVTEKGVPVDTPRLGRRVVTVTCDCTRLAVARLYSAWYGDPAKKLKLIAVTGTNGKTSVSVMLRTIFEAAFYKCGIIGTVACYSGRRRLMASPDDPLANMTTPDPRQLYRMLAFMVADKVDYVFIEASSHALKLHKLDAIEFSCGIFTNLTPEHLDFHKTMDDYLESKLRLFGLCRRAIVNADGVSPEVLRRVGETCPTLSCSARGVDADFRAEKIINDGVGGISYTLTSKNTVVKINSPIPGGFTVDNTLCAASCALAMGIPATTVRTALRSLSGVDGRVERIKTGSDVGFSVFIDYAHTPDALERLLKSFRAVGNKNGRLLLLFGCGGDRDREKRPEMGRIASSLADLCIITSDNSRGEKPADIINSIMSGFDRQTPYAVVEDRREAIDEIIRRARHGDTVILAGKGHEKYEIDSMGRHEFDEKLIAAEAIRKYHTK